MDALATRLSCAKVTLYSIAPSREELTIAVLRRFFDEAIRRIDTRLHPIGEPFERIRACVAGEVAEMKHMSPLCFEDVLHYGPSRDLYDSYRSAAAARLSDALVAGAGKATVDQRHVAFAVDAARRVLDGIYLGTLLDHCELTRDEAVSDLLQMVTAVTGNAPPPRRTQVRRIK